MSDRPDYCCGRCPEIVGGGYDCTCQGNPRCVGGRGTAGDRASDLLAEAWERHTKAFTPAEPAWCEQCDEIWPCLTIRLASELNSIPSRVGSAIRATSVSRADAEYQWPTCHKVVCHQDHGDIDAVFNLLAMRLKDTIQRELSCRAITEPDEGND